MFAPALTVYHDSSCPVCRLEIGHFRRQPGAKRIEFIDVSNPAVDCGPDLPRSKAMGRFHVRLPSGELRSGGAALVEIWKVLPFYRPAAWLAKLPGATAALNVGYEIASPLRPIAARFVKHVAWERRVHLHEINLSAELAAQAACSRAYVARGVPMECNEELIRLTDLLRIGVKTTRQIAGVRLRDRDLLLDIAERAEIMAQQLDAITGANTATVTH